MRADESHVSSDQLERLSDPHWRGEERDAVESHLADSQASRDRLRDQRQQSQPLTPAKVPPALRRRVEQLVPRRRRRPQARLVFASAAALLVLMVGFGIWRSTDGNPPGSETPIMRGEAGGRTASGAESTTGWTPLAPKPGEQVLLDGKDIAFRWPAVDEALDYRLVVLNRAGDRVFELESDATEVTAAGSAVGLGARSFLVEAQLRDGSIRRSSVIDFTIIESEAPAR